jgi:hypothetical protein
MASDRSPEPRRELAIDCVHIVTLVAFAVAQPLFDVLERSATFFVARQSHEVDLWALAFGSTLLLPLPLLALELAAGMAGAKVRRGVHLVLVSALGALVLLPSLKHLDVQGPWLLALALVAGLVLSALYARLSPARTFLTVLSPAPVIFAVLFLLHPSITKLYRLQEGMALDHGVDSETTIVMVVLDELPLASLIDESLEIDSQLFPNFARLASRSTWFRNATTSHNSSELAVPAILTGKSPSDPERLPIAVDHPNNLFSLLGHSHRMNVWETFTGLWTQPGAEDDRSRLGFGERMRALAGDLLVVYGHIVLPETFAARLPSVEANWGGFDATHQDLGDNLRGLRNQRFGFDLAYADRPALIRAFIESIDASEEPTLHFLHTIFPHNPWNVLPTGQQYWHQDKKSPGRDGNTWSDEYEWLSALGQQRHLLQVGHVDQLLGELIDALAEDDVYDGALFVLVSDHGCCFRRNETLRARTRGPTSVRDVLHVPLLVKRPFQTEAEVSDRNVETIDVLPTMLDALDIEAPWPMDGVSAFDSQAAERTEKTMYLVRQESPVVVSGKLPVDWPTLADKNRLFGSAPGWDGVYAMGPRPDLLGVGVDGLERAGPLVIRAQLTDPPRYEAVDPDADMLPALVEGRLFHFEGRNTKGRIPTGIVVAIDGDIRAVTETYDRSDTGARFSVMVNPSSLRAGANALELFCLVDGNKLAPFAIDYELEDDRIVTTDGRVYELRPGAFETHIEARQGNGHVALHGWAADFEAGFPAETVVVFLDGVGVVAGPMNRARPSLAERLSGSSKRAGFRYLLPLKLSQEETVQRVRVFALSGAVATEMQLQ